MDGNRTFLILWIFLHFIGICHMADPVFNPETLNDSLGNYADANSNITFAPVPASSEYQTDSTYDVGGLGVFYDMTRGFLNVIQPNDFPYDIIGGVVGGTYDIMANIMNVVMYILGFAICFVIGILFMIIMPIAGCCMLCCRCCCGGCGGSLRAKHSESASCKKIVFSIVLLLMALLMGSGIICTYISNSHMTTALGQFPKSVTTNLADINTFMNDTVGQIKYAAIDEFGFTKSVIFRDLDNIGVLMGVPLRDEIATTGGVDAALDSIAALDGSISTLNAQMVIVNASIADFGSKVDALKAALANKKTDIDSTLVDPGCNAAGCGTLDTSVLAVDADSANLPDFSSQMSMMDSVSGGDSLTSMANEGRANFYDTPNKVQNESAATIATMKTMINDFDTTISDALNPIEDMISGISGDSSPLAGVNTQVDDIFGMITPYDQYRWYAGIGLCSLIALIVLLLIIGVVMGLIGSSGDPYPTNRGCVSDSGGRMLLAATGFMFIFSWLLMLLISILFMVGGNLEKVLCQPIMDPEYKIFNNLLDGPASPLGDGTGGSVLGNLLLQTSTINLTFAGILDDCKNGVSAYKALKLSAMFDIANVTDYKSQFDLDAEIDKLNVDLSAVSIFDANTEATLNDFRDSLNVDFNSFITELSKNSTQIGLEDFAVSLETLRDATTPSPNSAGVISDFTTHASDIRAIETTEQADVDTAKAQLITDLNNFQAAIASVPAQINTTIDTAKAMESYVQNNASATIQKHARLFGDRILGTVDSFIAFVLNAVNEDIGKCTPIWNLYNSIFGIALCGYLVDAMNGFWFGLGWCVFFFIPSIVFSVLLQKYFRNMKSAEGFPVDNNYGTKEGPPFSNKIAHNDTPV
ncbi:unnamed protein product [Owenia fusiformis]|uniref:Prominin-1-A n=1 Tax=Owenia fusiformis TaxID=6347 RepID=A0A8S4NMP3_OWEFU|nr:unnamed protein product [Owenia fusiformis]